MLKDQIIQHYGVLGMHWGRHKNGSNSSTKTSVRSKVTKAKTTVKKKANNVSTRLKTDEAYRKKVRNAALIGAGVTALYLRQRYKQEFGKAYMEAAGLL